MTLFKKLHKDERGNFALMAGLMSSMIMLVIGMAMDTAESVRVRADLQHLTDAAAMQGAAAPRAKKSDRKEAVEESLAQNGAGLPGIEDLVMDADIEIDEKAGTVSVSVSYDKEPLFGGLIGSDNITIVAESKVAIPVFIYDNIRLVFVLDASSSMEDEIGGGKTRIEALKMASEEFFDTLVDNKDYAADFDDTMRSAMVAYDADIVETSAFVKGHKSTEQSIDSLNTGSGTNSAIGLDWAYNAIVDDRAGALLGQPWVADREFVILMTDGDNYSAQRDADSIATCDLMKSEGITIYTVGYAAPSQGVALLQACATPPDGMHQYFFDSQNLEDFKDAFIDVGKSLVEGIPRLMQ